MYIKQTHSTSSQLREEYSDAMPHMYTIRTDYQTAGRGQAGNSWESEEGKNLLYSSLLRYDGLKVVEQWRLSMLVAVTWWEVLAKYLPKEQLAIKWPNDIYWGERKLVGILIENSMMGQNVGHSIVGVGVNVNQTDWRSDAPNPISMKQITGDEYNVEQLLDDWIAAMKSWEVRTTEDIRRRYMQQLYRRTGWHKYVEREVSTAPTSIANDMVEGAFMAELVDITEQGELVLRKENNEEKSYHFKQIRFVI